MATKRRNVFYQKQQTTEIGMCNLPCFCDFMYFTQREHEMMSYQTHLLDELEVQEIVAGYAVGMTLVVMQQKGHFVTCDKIELKMYRYHDIDTVFNQTLTYPEFGGSV
ncbi:hypothetical protein AAG570_007489 [Ranatra chinensis]|uniref:Uncharacterized protein n=1 Tax=Ranatra chinensis TaxID=642074 RepID=A0ABD0YEJ3_9HEMI